MIDWQIIFDNLCPAGTPCRDILLHHSRQVCDLALEIAHRLRLPLSDDDIICAAMLHDIGISATDAPGIKCFGAEPYLCHGDIGARMLRSLGNPDLEPYALVCERHTGSGITAQEILAQELPMSPVDHLPQSLLERLICFADKFFSKSGDMQKKSIDRVRRSMERFGAEALDRFDALCQEFSTGSPG